MPETQTSGSSSPPTAGAAQAGTLELSVIVPTYNRRDSLLRTLNALARQTFPPDRFEVLVISDGATDGTAEAVRGLVFPFRLRFVEQENRGPAAARNHGARLAAAPVLVYVDDDVEPVESFLAEHAAAHADDDALILIGPQTGPASEPTEPWIAWEHRMLQKQYANLLAGVWPAGPNNLYSGNFSVRREHLLAAGGFDERFTRQEDVELGYRLEQKGLRFRFNPRADGIHRPTRSFAAWYRTPYEYGRRDVQMARDLNEPRALELSRHHMRERHPLMRLLGRCIGLPVLEPALLALGRVAIRHGGTRLALPACSLLFNLRYLQGMCRELGGRRQLWETLTKDEG